MPARPQKPDIRPRRPAHVYLAEWLESRKMTAEELADKMQTAKSVISKLMNGRQRYNQDWLEQIAFWLKCDVAQLYRPPLDPTAEELLSQLSPTRKKTAIGVLESLIEEDKTGTGG
jgi:transcriptional regulator with XRE-family HTH domain